MATHSFRNSVDRNGDSPTFASQDEYSMDSGESSEAHEPQSHRSHHVVPTDGMDGPSANTEASSATERPLRSHPWDRYREEFPGTVFSIDVESDTIEAIEAEIPQMEDAAEDEIRRSNAIIEADNDRLDQRIQACRTRTQKIGEPIETRLVEISAELPATHRNAGLKAAAAGLEYDPKEFDPLIESDSEAVQEELISEAEGDPATMPAKNADAAMSPPGNAPVETVRTAAQHTVNLPPILVKTVSIAVMGVMLGLSVAFVTRAVTPATLMPRLLLTLGFIALGIGLTIGLSQANYAIWEFAAAQRGRNRTILLAIAAAFAATIIAGEVAAEYRGVLQYKQQEEVTLSLNGIEPTKASGSDSGSGFDGALILIALLSSMGMVSLTAVEGLKIGHHVAAEATRQEAEANRQAFAHEPAQDMERMTIPDPVNRHAYTESNSDIKAYNNAIASVRGLVHERHQLNTTLLQISLQRTAEVAAIEVGRRPLVTVASDTTRQRISDAQDRLLASKMKKEALLKRLEDQITTSVRS